MICCFQKYSSNSPFPLPTLHFPLLLPLSRLPPSLPPFLLSLPFPKTTRFLCRPCWTWTHRYPPASASKRAGIIGKQYKPICFICSFIYVISGVAEYFLVLEKIADLPCEEQNYSEDHAWEYEEKTCTVYPFKVHILGAGWRPCRKEPLY